MNRQVMFAFIVFLMMLNPVVAKESKKVNSFSDKTYKNKLAKKRSHPNKGLKKKYSKPKSSNFGYRDINKYKPIPVDLDEIPH